MIDLGEKGYWIGKASDLPSLPAYAAVAQLRVSRRLADKDWVRMARQSAKPFYVNTIEAGDGLIDGLMGFGHAFRPYWDVELSHVGVFISGLERWRALRAYRGTQLPHFDVGDPKHVKLFVLLSEVKEGDQSALTFWSAPDSAPFNKGRSRVEERELDESAAIRLTGPIGTAAIVDVSRCIHYGSRGGRRDTLVLHWCSDPKKYSTRKSERFEDINVVAL